MIVYMFDISIDMIIYIIINIIIYMIMYISISIDMIYLIIYMIIDMCIYIITFDYLYNFIVIYIIDKIFLYPLQYCCIFWDLGMCDCNLYFTIGFFKVLKLIHFAPMGHAKTPNSEPSQKGLFNHSIFNHIIP